MSKKVLIFSRLTGFGAPQRRVDNLIELFWGSGFKAFVVRFDKEPFNAVISINQSLDHISLGNMSTMSYLAKIRRLNYSPKFAKNWIDIINPDVVVIYSTINYKTAKFIKNYCRKKKIRLIFDVVEYRSLFSSFSLRAFLSYNLHNFMINNKIISKGDNVVAISKFLIDFFQKKGLQNIFYYPITFNVNDYPKYNKKNNLNKVTFLYAGSPGGKRDLINEILVSFSMLGTNETDKIFLYICGIDEKGLIKEGVTHETLEKISAFTKIMGKVSKDELYTLMLNIDYTLLLKNEKKIFSSAGFPTKLAESFAFGIPMITNYSGDISLYLTDNYNGIVSKSYEPSDFVDAIKKGISIYEDNQHMMLAENAYLTALHKLNTPSYIDKFSAFLQQLNNVNDR